MNGKLYVGKHKADNPTYFTSGAGVIAARKKYGKENFKKEIIVQGNFNDELLNQLEKHYIRLYATNIPKIGYNRTAGGDGAVGLAPEVIAKRVSKFKGIYKHNLEVRVRMGKIHKGKKLSEEHKKKFVVRGRKKSKETIEKMLISRRAKFPDGKIVFSKEIRSHMGSGRRGKPALNRRPVLVFDLNNNFIAEYPSIKLTAEFLGNITKESLCGLITYPSKSGIIRGYRIRFKDQCQD